MRDFKEGELIFDRDDVLFRVQGDLAVSVRHGGALRCLINTYEHRKLFSREPRHGVTGRLAGSGTTQFRVVNSSHARHGAYADKEHGFYYHELDMNMHLKPDTIKGPFKTGREAYFAAAGL
jgi:hypothetical protein